MAFFVFQVQVDEKKKKNSLTLKNISLSLFPKEQTSKGGSSLSLFVVEASSLVAHNNGR